MLTILFIVTSHASMGDTGKPTGVWFEELAVPYYAFIDAGFKVDIVSISGGDIPIDPRSIDDENAEVQRFKKDEVAMASIKGTRSIEGLDTSKYAAVFMPGGHGTMWDYPDNKKLAEIVSKTLQDERVVGAVCHGPAALVSAKYEDGTPVVKGKAIAVFTNEEEEAVGLTDAVPFLLETRLEELGASISKVENFQPHAVVDGKLVTGQNPASSKAVAERIIELLGNS